MNSDEINDAIEFIGGLSGKNDKIKALQAFMTESDAFTDILVRMLDPRIRYGIAKKTLDKIKTELPNNLSEEDGRPFSFETEDLLDLLSKKSLTGHTAEKAILGEMTVLSDKSRKLIEKILLKKPDAGFTASSVNKARPNTIWTFDCMLAHPFDEKRVRSWPVVAEPKIDGVRCLIDVNPGGTPDEFSALFFSRSGKEYTAFDHLIEPLAQLYHENPVFQTNAFVIDCEIDSGQFNATVSQARKKDGKASDAVARVFDIMSSSEWTDSALHGSTSYLERRKTLETIFGNPGHHPLFQPVPRYFVNSVEEIVSLNETVTARGLEGLIIKPRDHLYQRKRSYDWMKIKGFETHDLVITDVFEGSGKYEGKLGGVICDFNGVDVRVGGGWTDEDRSVIWSIPESYIGRMIEVGSHEVTPDGSLRHPRFIRWRDDKHSAGD